MSTPATRSLEAVLRDALTTAPPLRLLVGTYGAASSDARYANVTIEGQALVLPKIKGIPDGASGQVAYVLAVGGRMLVLGTVST